MTTTMTPPSPLQYRPKQGTGGLNVAALWDKGGMVLVFVLLYVVASIFVPNFLSQRNMQGLAQSVVTVGMISCTMLFCLAGGDFDLSVGSIVAFIGVLSVQVTNYTGSAAMGILAGVVAGGLVGLFNGVVVAALGINALIATLATMVAVRGFALKASNNVAVGVNNAYFTDLGLAHTPGFTIGVGSFHLHVIEIPVPIWIMIACFLAFGFLLNKTTFGRNTLAIGGNSEAARLAGVPVVWTKIAVFTLQGMMAGFAGVILASRLTSGQPKTAEGLELQVISACVLGGVSLTGGVGSITAVIVGVLIMGMVQNTMALLNIDQSFQYMAFGGILLAAVMVDKLKHWKRA